jgi:5'-methylthioadenosine phosphorylase
MWMVTACERGQTRRPPPRAAGDRGRGRSASVGAVAIGIITGSGTHALPEFQDAAPRDAPTPYGTVALTEGRLAGVEAVHISRHGADHIRLSNQVAFRANAWALREAGVSAVVACTACGGLDPELEPGRLVVFDDLHFPVNRLPGGEVCTFFTDAGAPARGHWIFDGPFSAGARAALADAAREAGPGARTSGCYGHVDGPRFNTASEIRQLRAAGVTAVSQTGGPETVLFGELEVPYALVGFVTDYANGVAPEPTPVAELVRLMGRSTAAFAAVLHGALPRLEAHPPEPPGEVYRFHR